MTSLSHGVPCVSSSIGAEGMPVVAGDNLLVPTIKGRHALIQ
jgi:hypothetical protein